MKNKFGIVIAVVLIVAVAAGAVLINYNLRSTMKTMQFIESRIRPGGTFVDYDQSINVTSAEDLGWWKEGENWYVMYGKLQLEFTPGQLTNEAYLKQIERIGLDIRGDLEEGRLRFYWYGTELKEWVPQ